MINRNTWRRAASFALLVLLLPNVATLSPQAQQSGKAKGTTTATGAIRTTPPTPVFDEDARRAELAERRARVAKEVGVGGVLVLFSATPRLYTGDVDYKYRQENNLFYLTHLRQQGATLVLMPGNPSLREILFLPRRSPLAEQWNGRMYSPEEARATSGITEIWDSAEFKPFMQALSKRQPYRPKAEALLLSQTVATAAANAPPVAPASANGNAANAPSGSNSSAASTPRAVDGSTPSTVAAPAEQTTPSGFETLFAAAARNEGALYLLVPDRDADTGVFGDSREWGQEQRFAEDWKKAASGIQIRSAFNIFRLMRVRKSASEVRRIQHAIDITTEAIERAMATAGRARWEYEVEAEVDYIFKLRNADGRGYPSIVGSGANATTIHYEESQGRIAPGDMLLMDVGAEFDHYSADITRTFPVDGRFTDAQRDIYNLVLAAQDAGINAVRPGATLGEVHRAASKVLKDGLLRLGLITDVDSPQYSLWFPHGTSHWLGMNVHDAGFGNSKFEPGMVFTVEPGLYISPDALDKLPKTPQTEKFINAVRPAFERYKNIGVRIEDDILVTPDGHQNLSAALPRTIPDIEAHIARASREFR